MQITIYKTLKIQLIDEYILQISLNRPDVLNAINSEMMLELRNLWQNLYVEPKKLRCIILTGEGKAFCAGADLKERHEMTLQGWIECKAIFEQAVTAMLECPIPIIAGVNGPAYGGGLELILGSDFAYGDEKAVFAQSEVKVGLIPGAMGTQQLPRACGVRRAKELAYTGQSFNAQAALQWGIINQVSTHGKLMEECLQTAKLISQNAPLAVRQIKKCLNVSQNADLKTGFSFELEAYQRILPSKDRQEGIAAFNEKRTAHFRGE